MSHKGHNTPFLSCIKIRGLHFLPPVIDEERSSKLRKYKEEAIKLEKYLHNSKILHKRLEELSSTPKVSQTTVGKRTKHASLSMDIVDVTEYSNGGINVIDDGSHTFGKEGRIVINGSKKSPERNGVEFLFSRQSNKETARLDRRDSLPVQTSDSFKDESPPKQRLIRSNSYTLDTPSPLLLAYLEKEGVIKNSTENNLSLECSDHDSLSTVIINEDKKKPSSPKLEVIQTDISVQHISVNTQNGEGDSSLITDDQLVELLKNIPEEYSKKIINLIQQHKETKKEENVESEMSDGNTERPGTNEYSEKSLGTTSPSYTFYHTVSSSNTPLPSVNQLSKLESEALMNKPNTQICLLDDYDEVLSIRKCRMFAASEHAKRNQAASIIGAHVKGYLTRRLLKTERVQSIIKTIKDALMCALQMHGSDHIDQSDVELHRRLLNQVNAACYAFHEIFFDLPVHVQMSLISSDREHRASKEKRPYSAPSSRKSSTTPKSQFRGVMSKSLTKI